MGNTPLILAALAKAAMPELDLVHTGELQNFDDEKSVVVTARGGVRYEVRMPRTQAALLHLGLEIRSLQALTEAARTRLPFGVARLVGEAKHIKGARVWLFELVQGAPANLHRANANGTLAENLGEALGAIHNLPLTVVTDANLPEYNPADIALKYVTEMDRMAETGKVPAALLDRWQTALEDVSLFRYQPTVVHGALDSDAVLQAEVDHAQVVTGINSWSELHIGDPAEDLAFVFGIGRHDLVDSVLMAYNTRHPNNDDMIRQRAQLYSELAWGRYLLHSVNANDEDGVESAVRELEDLASRLEQDELTPLGKVEAPIAPIFAADALAFDADGVASDRDLDAAEHEYVNVDAEDLQIVEVVDVVDVVDAATEVESFAATDATAPIEVIDLAAADSNEASDATAPIETVEAVDDKTRPIELPERADNELF